jgi:glutamate-1-semialdehyde 2,1-aminomutase
MNRAISEAFYERAKKVIPGGVNSPVRAFQSVKDQPFYVRRGKGAYLFDEDGNRYLDYVASWGAIILGHAHAGLLEEVGDALQEGTSFGACHRYEVELAETLAGAFPSIEQVRLTSSGTEATMSAIRLARGFSGKRGVIKFHGCYHGHADSLLVKAGSGLATFSIPDSLGILDELARYTYVAEFNNIDSLWNIVKENRDVACVIVEPVVGNMGVILPEKDFLLHVQEICRKEEILFICDEVITGFRVAYGGAQHIYGVDPDLTCLGKIIGGGFPIGAFGGRAQIMERLAPLGGVYQAGTLSGNPIAVRAGIYTLATLKNDPGIYEGLEKTVEKLQSGILTIAADHGISYSINSITGMFTGFFTPEPVTDYTSAVTADRDCYERFFKLMLEEGIFFAPSPFEASFVTAVHGDKETEMTLKAYEKVFEKLKAL